MAFKIFHSKLVIFYQILLGTLIILPTTIRADCNICSSCGFACVSGTEFKVCVNGMIIGDANKCPSGTVCSQSKCQEPGPNTIEACQNCNKCDVTKTFACIGPNKYALCLGSDKPSQMTGNCQPNYICNINNPYICEFYDTTNEPSCPDSEQSTTTTTTTTTTTAAPATPAPGKDPMGFCQTIMKNGRFPVGNDEATTCRQYVYCFISSGVWRGQLYTCANNLYFNSETSKCETALPVACHV